MASKPVDIAEYIKRRTLMLQQMIEQKKVEILQLQGSLLELQNISNGLVREKNVEKKKSGKKTDKKAQKE